MQNMLKRSYSITKERSQKNTYSGLIETNELARLAQSVGSINKPVDVSFRIFDGYGDLPEIEGSYLLHVALKCQRCLSDMDFEIKGDFHFYISKREVESDDEDLEVVISQDGDLFDVISLIEDEIILNLPLIPKHETNCNEYLLQMNQQQVPEETKKNPFAVLEGLKTGLKH